MKTGEVAKRFSKDPKTIRAWTDEFAEHFNPLALGINGDQRDYTPGDIITLNTIRLSKGRDMPTEQIAYFYTKEKFQYIKTIHKDDFIIDKRVDEIEAEINARREEGDHHQHSEKRRNGE